MNDTHNTKTLEATSDKYEGPDPVDADENFTPEFLAQSKSSFADTLQKALAENHTWGFIVTIDPIPGDDGKVKANLENFHSKVMSGLIAPELAAKVADDTRLSFLSAMSGIPYEKVKRADMLVQKLGTQAAIKYTLSKIMGSAMANLGAEAPQDEGEDTPVEPALKN